MTKDLFLEAAIEVLAPFLSGRSKGVKNERYVEVVVAVLAPFLSGRSKGGWCVMIVSK